MAKDGHKKRGKKADPSRRDFVAAGVGAAVGFALFGIGRRLASRADGAPDVAGASPALREPAGLKHNERPGGIATPHAQLKKSYDVVVIGSGYGGSILAARLASHGRSLCVLERGREWLPGDFPTTDVELANSLRTPQLNPLGLLELNSPMKADLDVVAGCGLGGTSLINAAIASRPEDLVWEQKEWPQEIRDAYRDGSLDHYFEKAEDVLQPTVAEDADQMPKVRLHQQTLAELGVKSDKLRLNVNHGKPNPWGATQSACISCGNCCSGCNVGAKNATQFNYLPIAKARGARIFVGMEVKYVEKLETGGWRVHYVYHAGGFGAWPRASTLDAKLVVLSAGSQGSTEILMRSQDKAGLKLSGRLGYRMSANGDVLGFGYNGRTQTNVIGNHEGKLKSGQALMSYGDYRKANRDENLLERFLLIEGTIPEALAGDVAKLLAGWGRLHSSRFSDEQLERIKLDLKTRQPGSGGALNHSMLFLACGHDSAKGRYVYHGDHRPRVVWPDAGKERSFEFINKVMEEHAGKHGALWLPNPRTQILDQRLAATHPLGGCPMGADVDHGVVDHAGRVFDESGALHEGLYVADGSIIPRSLGATPLMTISALSERIADIVLATELKK